MSESVRINFSSDKKILLPTKVYFALLAISRNITNFEFSYKRGTNHYKIISYQPTEESESEEEEQPQEEVDADDETESDSDEDIPLVEITINKEKTIIAYDEFWAEMTNRNVKTPKKALRLTNFKLIHVDMGLHIIKSKDSLCIQNEDLKITIDADLQKQLLNDKHEFIKLSDALRTVLFALL